MKTLTSTEPVDEKLQQIKANTVELQQLWAEIEANSNATPPASSPAIPWAWILAGLGIGLTGGVALALTLTGALA